MAFFVDAATDAGSPVLEVGCGTGRVLIPSALAGISVTGLDASPEMLDQCRKRLSLEDAAVQSRVELVQADMRTFSLGREFTLATLPFCPFQHLITVEDQLSCLMNIRRHLVDRGRVVLDLFNPSLDALGDRQIGEELGDEPEFTTPDGRRVVRRQERLSRPIHRRITSSSLYYVTHPDGRQNAWCNSR